MHCTMFRVCLAHRVVQSLGSPGPGQAAREANGQAAREATGQAGRGAREAAREGLNYMYQRVGGSGGVICVDREGRSVRPYMGKTRRGRPR